MIKEIAEHRSFRKFQSRAIAEDVMRDILTSATRASTCGNMQLYSLVVTIDPTIKGELSPCHFNQPMVNQAPCLVTVCADVHRFSEWCKMRGAEPRYDNFAWFLNGVTDALLASQNLALAAEAHGLGVCYLGTTLYTAERICEVLSLPQGVLPITTLVVGFPDEGVGLTDRLPLDAVVHTDRYEEYSAERLEALWAEKESSELTAQLLVENGQPTLAHVFTQNRYKAEDNLAISKSYFELLKKRGFFNQ